MRLAKRLSLSDAWKRFLILYSIQFLQLLDFISITPIGAMFVKHGKISSETISSSIAVYSVAAIIASVLMIRVSMRQKNKWTPKESLSLLLGVFSISQFVLVFRINALLFITAKLIGGLTGGLMGSIAYSQIYQIDSGKDSGLWNGRIQSAQSLVTIVGLPVCLFMIELSGSTLYFGVMSSWALIVFLVISRTKLFDISMDSASTADSLPLESKRIGEDREPALSPEYIKRHLDVLITGFVCYFAAFLFITQMPNYLINDLGTSAGALSVSYTAGGLLVLAFSGLLGKFAEKGSAMNLLSASLIIILIPQIVFQVNSSSAALLYFGLPTYLLISNARAIYQRAIILEKPKEDSFALHMLNNIAVRTGIMASGLFLGSLAIYGRDLRQVFHAANAFAMILSIVLIIALRLFQWSGVKTAMRKERR